MPLIGQTLAQYRVTAALGAGGMGEVYRATDTRLGREVALKLLPAAFACDPERLARFAREAKLLASLNHPNIAQLYAFDQATLPDGSCAHLLAMELVIGEDLAERLKRGPIPVDETIAIAKQVAEALEEAHEKGIVHRDLKPANVKVRPDGRVKVLDFGLAKAWTADASGVTSAPDLSQSPTLAHTGTAAGIILGTAAYMAPEQARGKPVDKRADIWAFGVLLFEMLAGRRLFAGETLSDTLAALLGREIDWSSLPAATPLSVRRVLAHCLERDVKNRLHDVADARIELQHPGETTRARRSSLPARVAPWALAGAAVVLAAGALLRGRSPVRPSPSVVRFTVTPSAPGSFESYPALSPDGRSLAYTHVAENGPSLLWLHSFATGTARPLAGTEDAFEPFWSPDGRSVAFFAAGELRVVDVASGAVQSVCAAPDPRGGTWGSRGEILFGTTATSGLRRVRPGDGSLDVLTEVDTGHGGQSHRFPWFLPDGRHYVFTVLGDEEVAGLYFGDTAGSGYRRLSPDFSRAAYDPRGYLLFVRAGTLVAQRFDPERGSFSGQPSPVTAQPIGANIGAESWFAAGPDVVAYRPSPRQSTRLLWVDRAGAVAGEVTSPGAYMEPDLSRDGRKVVTEVQAPEKVRIQLWVYDTDGHDRGQRLPVDARVALGPIWSPDQRWVVYRARGAGIDEGTLAKRAVNGAARDEVLLSHGPARLPCAWSPDGGTILFTQSGGTSGSDLWAVDAEAPHAVRPVLKRPGNQGHASFSPDGRLIAYTSDEDRQPQVFVETFPPSGARWQVTSGGGDYASWRADGREIYYVGVDRMLYSVPVRSLAPLTLGAAEALFRITAARAYVTGPRSFYGPAPDGRRFLVARAASSEEGSRVEVVLNWAPDSPGESPSPAPAVRETRWSRP